MNKAWLLLVVVGTSGLVAWRRPVTERPISTDPSAMGVVEPARRPEASPTIAGAATPLRFATEPQQQGRPRSTPRIALDYVEPWTGEDLAPVLAAAATARPRAVVDRHDPWDPSIEYPVGPAYWTPGPDGSDPWVDRATLPSGEVAQTKPAPKPAARVVDHDDPWASGAPPASSAL
jgi:hypothetical protein